MPAKPNCVKNCFGSQSNGVFDLPSSSSIHQLWCSLHNEQIELHDRLFGVHLFLSASSSLRSGYFFGFCTEITTILSVLSWRAVPALPFRSSMISLFHETSNASTSGDVLLRIVTMLKRVHAKRNTDVGIDGCARNLPTVSLQLRSFRCNSMAYTY